MRSANRLRCDSMTALKLCLTAAIGLGRRLMTALRMNLAGASALRRRPIMALTTGFAAATVAIIIAVVALAVPPTALAQNYTVDTAASEALTNYLRQNRLPLVGAQIGCVRIRSAAPGPVRLRRDPTWQKRRRKQSRRLPGNAAARSHRSHRHSAGDRENEVRRGSPVDSGRRVDAANSRAPVPSAITPLPERAEQPAGAFPGQSFDQVVNDIQRYGIKSPPDEAGQ